MATNIFCLLAALNTPAKYKLMNIKPAAKERILKTLIDSLYSFPKTASAMLSASRKMPTIKGMAKKLVYLKPLVYNSANLPFENLFSRDKAGKIAMDKIIGITLVKWSKRAGEANQPAMVAGCILVIIIMPMLL